MKRLCLLLFLLLCALPAAPTRAFTGSPDKARADLVQHDGLISVIVQLRDAPLATYEGGIDSLEATRPANGDRLDLDRPAAQRYEAYLHAREQAVLDQVRQHLPSVRVTHHYTRLFNGFAAEVAPDQVQFLRQVSGVKRVTYDRFYQLLLNDSTRLIGAPALWNKLSGQANAGRGIKIAILDSGIDVGGDRLTSPPTPDNPFFNPAGFSYPPGYPKGNTDFTTPKVIAAHVYINPDLPASSNTYAATPRDDTGHGSHVAGIAAGVVTRADARHFSLLPPGTLISGVAPGAYLMNYKVCYNFQDKGVNHCIGSGILQALNDAIAEKADVINMSLGGPAQPLDLDPVVDAVEAAVKAGVTVAVAAGNDGPDPETVSSPATAPNVIAVAASGNSHFFAVSFRTLGPGTPFARGTVAVPGIGEMAFTNFGPHIIIPAETLPHYTDIHGCKPEPPGSLTGKIVLIQRGGCDSLGKLKNAKAAGTVGAVVWGNYPGELLTPLSIKGVPVVFISNADGKILDAYARKHRGTKVQTLGSVRQYRPSERLIHEVAFFSSRGITTAFGIKPDLTAPGENIYSAAQTNNPAGEVYNASGSTVLQGTSMASPHIAGAVALVLAVHRNWTPAQVKSALMSTADATLVNNLTGSSATLADQGAGLVNLSRATTPGLTFDKPSISFGDMSGDGSSGPPSNTVTITAHDVSGHNGAWTITTHSSVGLPDGVRITAAHAVTIRAGARATFEVHAEVAAGILTSTGEGDFILTNGTTTLHIPFFVNIP